MPTGTPTTSETRTMANTLTNVMPRLLASGLKTLREQSILPRLVNADYGNEAKEKGETIDVPVPVAVGVEDVVPGPTPPAPADTTPGLVQIPLDQWKKSSAFHLTHKQAAEINANANFIPGQVSQAARALANTVNSAILATYTDIYGYIGTAGTTPFGSGIDEAVDSRKVLNDQLAPPDMRRVVLDTTAEANALKREEFSSAEKTADGGDVKIRGNIGTKFGMDWYWDNSVPTHTAGTGSGYLVNGTPSVGAKVLPVDTGSGTFVVGDIITIAGNTQTYVVTAALGAPGNLAIEPGLVAAPDDGAAITLKATHVVNLAFHKDCFAFANRPLSNGAEFGMEANPSMTMRDPLTGIILRLEMHKMYKQFAWEFDILYGVKCVRRELGCRIAG